MKRLTLISAAVFYRSNLDVVVLDVEEKILCCFRQLLGQTSDVHILQYVIPSMVYGGFFSGTCEFGLQLFDGLMMGFLFFVTSFFQRVYLTICCRK